MSNVTPGEIVDLVCAEFGLLPIELKGKWLGNWRATGWPPALKARKVAVHLIRRHTQATNRDILLRFGMGPHNPSKVRDDDNHVKIEVQTDRELRATVARIENAIDQLHEARGDLGAAAPAAAETVRRLIGTAIAAQVRDHG